MGVLGNFFSQKFSEWLESWRQDSQQYWQYIIQKIESNLYWKFFLTKAIKYYSFEILTTVKSKIPHGLAEIRKTT